MFHNFLKNTEPIRVLADGTNYNLTAGTGSTTSAAIDSFGNIGSPCASIVFGLLVGTVTSTGTITGKIDHSLDNAVTDAYADIAGSHIGPISPTSGQMFWWEIWKPQKRWFEFLLTRATANVVIDGLVVFRFWGVDTPVTFGSTVNSTLLLNSPASGTA